jgi:hypothetical protein
LFVTGGRTGVSFPSCDFFSVEHEKKVASPERPSRYTRFFNFISGFQQGPNLKQGYSDFGTVKIETLF